MVRIPSETKKCRNESLRRCIEFAASGSGSDEFQVAEIMSLFLEQLADENTKGRIVQIPGFGAFFPVPDTKVHDRGGVLRCRVRFHPSVGYQQQVKNGAPPQLSVLRRFKNYRTNHSAGDRVAGTSSRVFTGMQKFREALSSQMSNARGG